MQNEKSQQQQQMILKYIEGMIKEQLTTMHEPTCSSSKTKVMTLEMAKESKTSKKEEMRR